MTEYTEKELYIVLSQTGSVLSRLIRRYTHYPYSHSSISLRRDLKLMYSFGRTRPYNPLRGGFVTEGADFGTFKRFKNTEVQVLSLPVSEEEYNNISDIIEEMLNSDKRYKYNMIGVFYAAFGKKINRKNCFYCSEFISMLLKKGNITAAEVLGTVVQPEDFTELPGARTVYKGKLRKFTPETTLPAHTA